MTFQYLVEFFLKDLPLSLCDHATAPKWSFCQNGSRKNDGYLLSEHTQTPPSPRILKVSSEKSVRDAAF